MQTRGSFRRVSIATLTTLLIWAQSLEAQSTSGAILGTVQDETSGHLPGVTITVRDVGTDVSRSVVTDEEGRFRVPALNVGTYDVEATLPGFRTQVREGVELTIGRQAVVDFTLPIGEVSEKVLVLGQAVVLETTNAIVSNLVDGTQIRELPLNSRDLNQLTLLSAGVVAARTSFGKAQSGFAMRISIGGGRPQSNSFLLDGTDINLNASPTPGSVAGVQLGVDGVAEFRVITNAFSAEFGRAGAGVMTSVSRAGTNELHGSVFEFHRNDSLDAANFFDQATAKPDFLRNQYGFALGGPLRRGGTFFFVNYEGLHERLGVSQTANVLTQAAREGRLPGRTVTVHNAIPPYLALFPLPNGRDFGDGRGEFHSVVSRPTSENYAMGRLDHTMGQQDSIFGRYTFDDGSRDNPHPLGTLENELRSRVHYVTVEHKRIVGTKGVNQLRFAFNRSYLSEIDNGSEALRALYFVDEPLATPSLSVTGLANPGGSGLNPKIYRTESIQLMNDFTYVLGTHSLKFGGSAHRAQFNQRSDLSAGGGYGFQTIADFLQNLPRTFAIQFPGSDTNRRIPAWYFGGYLQDDIQIGSQLSLNLGVRYEGMTDPVDKDGKISVIKNVLDPAMTLADIETGGALFAAPKLSVAPRVGVAWSPLPKTVVRGGFGVFFDTITNAYYQIATVRMPPFREAVAVDSLFRPVIFPDWEAMNLVPDQATTMETFPFDVDAPYYMRYSLNVQQEILPTTVVSVTYSGARGIHLLRHIGANLAVPQVQPDGSRLYPAPGRLHNPNFGSIRTKLTDGNSDYHSLGVEVRKRTAGGLQLQAAFNWSQSIDDGPAAAGNGDFVNDNMMPREFLTKDRARSPWNLGRTFAMSAVYELPFGRGRRWLGDVGGVGAVLVSDWQLAGLVQITDGVPFSAQLGYVPAGFIAAVSDQTYYPDLVPGADNNPVLGGPDRYFDATAFSVPAAGRVGNLARNSLTGPGFATVDLSVTKNQPIGAGRMLQVRVEAFNLLNRANFATPVTSIFLPGSTVPRADAGRITQTSSTSRQVQLGLRFIF